MGSIQPYSELVYIFGKGGTGIMGIFPVRYMVAFRTSCENIQFSKRVQRQRSEKHTHFSKKFAAEPGIRAQYNEPVFTEIVHRQSCIRPATSRTASLAKVLKHSSLAQSFDYPPAFSSMQVISQLAKNAGSLQLELASDLQETVPMVQATDCAPPHGEITSLTLLLAILACNTVLPLP
eukprot:836524-Amphidinium_carterae.1